MEKYDKTFLLRRLTAKFFWDSYDFLGRLILINMILFLFGGLLFFFFYSLGMPIYQALEGHRLRQSFLAISFIILSCYVLGGFSFSGIIYFASKIKNESEPVFKDIFIGFKKFGVRSALLGLILALIHITLIVNILFYASGRFFPPQYKFMGIVLAGICFWGIMFVFAITMFSIPFLITQESTILRTLKMSAALVLDNFILTLYTAGIFVILLFLSIAPKGVGIPFFVISFSGILFYSLFDNVVLKYKIKESLNNQNNSTEKKENQKFVSWKDRKVKEEKITEEHDRYKRTLRDILKPWEY